MLTEHNHGQTQCAESPEPLQERRARSGLTAVRLQNMLRGEGSGDPKKEGSEFELELRSTLA